ncbi:MAG: hypothetical protein FWC50_16405 [Planctomycetaceae bacterium]|nr:hypothetical protein [Planctomycetaceae bacterium]
MEPNTLYSKEHFEIVMPVMIKAKVDDVFKFSDQRTIFVIINGEIKSLKFFKGVECCLLVNGELLSKFPIWLETFRRHDRPELWGIGTSSQVDIDSETIKNNDCHVEFSLENDMVNMNT